ncbi:MAG TPA: hypothetical protein ENI97_10535 [Gammaproteobacteria bacterium]|nr:hypothetical protein [Gammaproteobacteria bacterium]
MKKLKNVFFPGIKNEAGERTNSRVRQFWQKKKERLRYRVAFVLVMANIVGLELAAPNYSLSSEISKYFVSRSGTLQSFIEYFRTAATVEPGSNPMFFHDPIKYVVLLSVSGVMTFVIFLLDPLSNPNLIGRLGENKVVPRFWEPWLRDLSFYARCAPSNILPTRCGRCRYRSSCKNVLDYHGVDKIERWNELVSKLNPGMLDTHLRAVHNFRRVFFWKHSALLSAVFLSFVYLVVRFLENAFSLQVYRNLELIAFIVLLLAAYFILCIVSKKKELHQGGAYQMYKQSVSRLARSKDFNDLFERYVCNAADPVNKKFDLDSFSAGKNSSALTMEARAIQLRSVLMQLDRLVKEKSIDMMHNGVVWRRGDRASIRRILEKIIDLYSAIFPDEACFRTCIFIPDYEKRCLRPWLWANSLKSCPIDFNFEFNKNPEFNEVYFSFDSNGPVSSSWRGKEIISTSRGIVDLEGVETPKSIIAYPILCAEEQLDVARGASIDLPEIFGVLCVVSNEGKVFSQEREKMNKRLIRSFVDRIIFESIQAYLIKIKDGDAEEIYI